MKRIYILIPIVIILFACDSLGFNSAANKNLTVREKTVGASHTLSDIQVGTIKQITDSFFIGLPRQDVFDTLGDPDIIFYGNITYTPGIDYDADAYHIYRDIGLSFRIFDDAVMEITLLNNDWIASNGLAVGIPLNQMLQILGDNYQLVEDQIRDFYTYQEYDIMVEVLRTDDTVFEININEGNVG